MKYFILFLCTAMLVSCWGKKPYPYEPQVKVWGWKAVMGADSTYKKITYSDTAVKMDKPGKIYVKGNIIYQNDLGKGIHIINNTVPSAAKRVSFIGVPGNSDIAIKGNYMYANNYNDIVVIDISNSAAPKEISRQKNMFFTGDTYKPMVYVPTPAPGPVGCRPYTQDSVIISWIRDSIYSCYYY